jgi:uncharacterized protein
MVSPVVHFQLVAKDIEAAKKYYSEVMGWEFGEGAPGTAGSIETGWADDITVAGTLMELQAPMQPGLVAAIRLDDVAGAIAKSNELGGTTIMEPTLLPQGVTIAVIQSPEGVAHTLVQQ